MISFRAVRGSAKGVGSLLGRIWVQIDIVDGENIVARVSAKAERVIAGYGWAVVDEWLLLVSEREGFGGNQGGQ